NPTISLLAPADGTQVGGTTTFSAAPLDLGGNDSNIDHVDFFIDSAPVITDSSSPWSVSYNTSSLADGDYPWSAKAYDKAGNNVGGASRAIKVRNNGYYTAAISPTAATVGVPTAYTLTVTNSTPLASVNI